MTENRARPGAYDHATVSDLLVMAAGGDEDAFMRFFDATVHTAYSLALCRLGGGSPAAKETEHRYVEAWIHAGRYRRSGLSPLTWLLSLPVPPRSRLDRCAS